MLKACCHLGYCQTALCDVVLEGTVFSGTLFQKDSLSPALYLVFYDIIIILPQDMYMGVVVAVEMPGLSLSSLGGSIVHQMFELHTLLK